MKTSGFRKQTAQEIKEKQDKTTARRIASLKAKQAKAKKLPPKPKKPAGAKNKPKKTARVKKMEAKKKLCEQYDLPNIPCGRWGVAKTFSRQDLLKGMLWTVFSKYIRTRDKDKPCITCGLIVEAKQAGHYLPVGGNNLNLCFFESNVNGECPTCNADFNGWHLVPMRKNMVKRYGEQLVDELDKQAGTMTTVKWEESRFVNKIKDYLNRG